MPEQFTTVLEQAIESLIHEQKVPTVALVKSRLNQPIPMAIIIQGLQRWKQNGQIPQNMQAAQPSSQQRIETLEAQVATLTARLNILEERLKMQEGGK